jgi:hypothetical protein
VGEERENGFLVELAEGGQAAAQGVQMFPLALSCLRFVGLNLAKAEISAK